MCIDFRGKERGETGAGRGRRRRRGGDRPRGLRRRAGGVRPARLDGRDNGRVGRLGHRRARDPDRMVV
nr:MAG TPA: hypothetical protein [Caudoviricetes sp.]